MDGKGDKRSSSFSDSDDETTLGVGNGEEGEYPSCSKELSKRIQALREIMYSLKEQLKDEKELWRREIDELNKLQYEESLITNSNLEPNIFIPSESMSASGIYDKKTPQFLNESSITVYEKHLQRCPEVAGLGLHGDYQQMKRQLAAHSYKRKLMEVERMCNLELARVKQTASYLEPLNKIASEWNLPQNETHQSQKFLSTGDIHFIPKNYSSEITENQFQLSSDLDPSSSRGHLSICGCEREHLNNMDSSYSSSTAEMNLEQNEGNNFCECEDIPLKINNKLWIN